MTHSGNGSAPDELAELLDCLPEEVRRLAVAHQLDNLIEFVLDLGRRAELRFPGSFITLPVTVTPDHLGYVLARTGRFRADNRVGIPGTLHRISGIMDRYNDLVGVTMRVGRHVPGAAAPLARWLEAGSHILLLGPPGAGKTTVLRNAAAMLSTDMARRVMIVDTSNEIGGDGFVPHPGIGHARRIQVPDPARQYEKLLEAVKNHTPDCVVIDEISTSQEAAIAATIAERGVQLLATAHGKSLANLVNNPDLQILVGGVRPVSQADTTAALRIILPSGGAGRQTALERIKGPVFDVIVELTKDEYHSMAIHEGVAAAVDAILDGAPIPEVIHVSDAMNHLAAALFPREPSDTEGAPAAESSGPPPEEESDPWDQPDQPPVGENLPAGPDDSDGARTDDPDR